MIVDVHAHCYPKPYIEELKRIGGGDEGQIGIKIPEWSGTEERIEGMDSLGIDIQVLSLSAPNVYFQDAELSKTLAQMTNDFLSDVCKEHPDRFLCFASIPLNNLKYAFDELDRAINDLEMDGIALGTNINQRSLSEDQFLPFFEEVDKRKTPIHLHPMRAMGEDLMPPEDIKLAIPSNVGFIFETTRTIAQMTFKGTFEKYKNLTFILSHSGGAIPFVYPRWDSAYFSYPHSHPLKKLPNPPSHYLKKHYYDTALSYSLSSLRCTIDFAGIDHVLFGTDFPYSIDNRAKETIEKIENYGFSKKEKEKIYFKNVTTLFPKIKNNSSHKSIKS
jgi:predicted TIM-barrel fold metal-dependent hydrolase